MLRGLVATPALLLMGMHKATAKTSATTFALTPPVLAASLAAHTPADVARQLAADAEAQLTRGMNVRALVHTQGLLPHEGERDASLLAQKDWRQTLTQALAFRVSGVAAYGDKAAAYIEAWLPAYRSSANPVDETDLTRFLFGLDLVRDRLHPSAAALVQPFAEDLARAYLDPDRRVGDDSTLLNNWHSHRVKLATAGAYLSGKPALIAEARRAFVAHVASNVRDDGSTYDFAQRDAMHYVVYTLEPLLMAASMARAHGQDWYGAQEIAGRLPMALQWLGPYARGEREHEEFVRSSVKFDARRAAAKVKGYSGLWEPAEAADLYWIAAHLDVLFAPMVARFQARPTTRALFAG
ncbi:alginate lyase family protein [Cupriavidus basilensis]|uniref:Alginate lyase family protein n=1 Tax=Cupriavidus basilensis TaxID=68895 RepID=A0A643FYK9_9BURK|nr:alginate lyase family protein [Cupriavidus basilensis]QOT82120.1 alginate lyase family protein [Cupriavidus basilensis]